MRPIVLATAILRTAAFSPTLAARRTARGLANYPHHAGRTALAMSTGERATVPITRSTKAGAGPAGSARPVRVRFAPSPTGTLHVGGARTALFNWLVARGAGDKGTFVLRIEDTDEARSTRASEEAMIKDLKWLGLKWDEGPDVGGPFGPYRQSERMKTSLYQEFADQLQEAGRAYPCFCTQDELDASKALAEAEGRPPQYDGTWRDADPALVAAKIAEGVPYTVRFKVGAGQRVTIDDLVRGVVSWDAEATVGDFILLRSNGMPVYNFCVAIDDATMEISHVIRAEEHLTNTLRQGLILEALGKPLPTYAHCSLILGEDRSKLSKRHGATSCDQYRQDGFLPDAMINYLTKLGWNDGSEQEIYTVPELVESFSMNRIIKAPAVFDTPKLRWTNSQHLRALPEADLDGLVAAQLAEEGAGLAAASPAFVRASVAMLADGLELVGDAGDGIAEALAHPLAETLASDECAAIVADDFAGLAAAIVASADAGALPAFGTEGAAAEWKAWIKALGKDTERKGKRLFHPVRVALTGRMSGPDVGDQLSVVALAPDGAEGLVGVAERVEVLRGLS